MKGGKEEEGRKGGEAGVHPAVEAWGHKNLVRSVVTQRNPEHAKYELGEKQGGGMGSSDDSSVS